MWLKFPDALLLLALVDCIGLAVEQGRELFPWQRKPPLAGEGLLH